MNKVTRREKAKIEKEVGTIKDKTGEEYKIILVEEKKTEESSKITLKAVNKKGEEVGKVAASLLKYNINRKDPRTGEWKKKKRRGAHIQDVETKKVDNQGNLMRRRGIATELMKKLEEEITKRGYHHEEDMFVVNPSAARMYEKLGFEKEKSGEMLAPGIGVYEKKSPSRKVREAWNKTLWKIRRMKRRH